MTLPVPQPLIVFSFFPFPLFPTLVGGSYERYLMPPKKKGIFFKTPKFLILNLELDILRRISSTNRTTNSL